MVVEHFSERQVTCGRPAALALRLLPVCAAALAGCAGDRALDSGPVDQAISASADLRTADVDAAVQPDLAVEPPACGSPAPPDCRRVALGPAEGGFSLDGDIPPDNTARASGLRRDQRGRLVLDGGAASGDYSVIVRGCTDKSGLRIDTPWIQVAWSASVPAGSALSVRARAAEAATFDDPAWSAARWTPDAVSSPLPLQGTLVPNPEVGSLHGELRDGWLMIQLHFTPSPRGESPVLERLVIGFSCWEIA